MEASNTTYAVQRFLDELAACDTASDDPVIRELLARSVNRIHLLCTLLLYRSYPRLTRAPGYLDADEVLSAVVERMLKALQEIRPQSVRQFFALTNRHIRWELNDLARRIDQQRTVQSLDTGGPAATLPPSSRDDTDTLRRILAAIDALPEEEREVFEFVRVQGMTHSETAEVLGVANKTVQRRLRRSILLLSDALRDLLPAGAASDQSSPLAPF